MNTKNTRPGKYRSGKPRSRKRNSGKFNFGSLNLDKLLSGNIRLGSLVLPKKTLLVIGLAVILLVGILLIVLLPGRNNAAVVTPAASLPADFDPTPAGSVLLNANAAVEITYNASEQVVAILGADPNGEALVSAQGDVTGRDITDVTKAIIQAAITNGYPVEGQHAIVLKQGRVSLGEIFLQNLIVDVQSVSGTLPLVFISRTSLTSVGYIDLEGAKSILISALGLDEDTEIEGNPEPEEERYVLSYQDGEATLHYTVDAVTGTVAEATVADYDENIVLGIDPEGTMYDPKNPSPEETEFGENPEEDTVPQDTLETEEAHDEGFITDET